MATRTRTRAQRAEDTTVQAARYGALMTANVTTARSESNLRTIGDTMSDRPPITTIVTTYAPNDEAGVSRRKALKVALSSWELWLEYSGPLKVHIADDGSTLPGYPFEVIDVNYDSMSQQDRHGVGASLNAGLEMAHRDSPLTAYFVDDWALNANLDLTPWADLLMRDQTIGMVRLGPPHPNISGEVVHDNGLWYLRLHPHHFAFGHRPALFHKRLYDSIGYYQEDCSALQCEYDFNQRYMAKATLGIAPKIVLALLHPWSVIPNAELGNLNPTTEMVE